MNTLRRLLVSLDGYVNYLILYILYMLCTLFALVLLITDTGPSLIHHFGFASLLLMGIFTFSLPREIVANHNTEFICKISSLGLLPLIVASIFEDTGNPAVGVISVIILWVYTVVIDARK